MTNCAGMDREEFYIFAMSLRDPIALADVLLCYDRKEYSKPVADAHNALRDSIRKFQVDLSRAIADKENLKDLLREYISHSEMGAVDHRPGCDLVDRARSMTNPTKESA